MGLAGRLWGLGIGDFPPPHAPPTPAPGELPVSGGPSRRGWKGSSVLPACTRAVSDERPTEMLGASERAARLRLLRQPMLFGFAAGHVTAALTSPGGGAGGGVSGAKGAWVRIWRMLLLLLLLLALLAAAAAAAFSRAAGPWRVLINGIALRPCVR